IFQTVYPYVCKLKVESENVMKIFLVRFNYLCILFFFLFGLFVYFFADSIIYLLSNEKNEYSVFLLQNMSFIPMIIGINIAAYQTFLIYNYKKAFLTIMISASLVNIMLNIILGRLW